MQLFALLGGFPAVAATLILLWSTDSYAPVRILGAVVVIGTWLMCAAAIQERVASPLRTLASLLEAMREGDFTVRGRGAQGHDALGEVMRQINEMAATLRAQRLGALEATTLLKKVIEEIDAAIFAFDAQLILRLVNPAGERLLGQSADRLMTLPSDRLGLAEFLTGESSRTVERTFSGNAGRWAVRRSSFREDGLPHHLLVITDLTRALREEELLAWQRIVRVLGHELNNSLTPIHSIAQSLSTSLLLKPRPDDWEEDMISGLHIISARSDGLSRFLGAYARLARLPRPRLTTVVVEEWIRRVMVLDSRVVPVLSPGPPGSVQGDADQLDQLLINLLRNAADASAETGGEVAIGWHYRGHTLQVYVRDAGLGIANPANLFVPFFTTKPGGSGIGLVLSRQIAEAHRGSLTLTNREDGPGCEAILTLPVEDSSLLQTASK